MNYAAPPKGVALLNYFHTDLSWFETAAKEKMSHINDYSLRTLLSKLVWFRKPDDAMPTCIWELMSLFTTNLVVKTLNLYW